MTSASTLIRKATKAKPAEAKRLRAQAAKIRREARARKKKPNKILKGLDQALEAALPMPPPNRAAEGNAQNAMYVGKSMHFEHSAEQGWAPVDPMAERAEALLKLARHKATTADTIRNELARIARNAGHEAEKQANRTHIEALKRIHEQNAINVVAAFVAAAEGWARANGGPMPPTAIIAGHTLARVVDALKNAGYTADGLRSMSRGALEARLNR